jgi:hypothetical protein
MTRKHFLKAAEIVNNQPTKSDAKRRIALAFCEFFASENPRFDKERFLTACGVES